MRAAGLIRWLPLALILPVVIWLWWGGGMTQIEAWAAAGQRDAQNALARTLRALRTGEPGALAGLMGVAFLYGLFHAAGPGHGKLLIGGYGMGRPVAATRLAGLALLSSLAQSATAVLLVLAGIGLLGWTRDRVTGLADTTLTAISYLAIAGVGSWLALRGARALARSRAAHAPHHHHDHDHHHDHAHGPDCGCGHAHAPTPEDAARVQSLRDALALIGAIAVRPCTGALFLLIISWRMDILPAGIAGTFAMGLGTASITILAALAAVTLRRSSLDRIGQALPDATQAARAAALTELAFGALICAIAVSLALRVL